MESTIPTRKLDDYILGPMLGKGFFGHVRIAKKMSDSSARYAIKYMKIGKPHSRDNLIQMLQQEAALRNVSHPNILQVYSINGEGSYEKIGAEGRKIPVVYAVLQLARSGDLFDFLVSSGGFGEDVARFFFARVLSSVEHLHFLGIAHRDLKLENVLLDLNFNPLLTDFGLCRYLCEIGFTTNHPANRVGTERSMSPELFAGQRHSPVKDDLFALGYLLFMMVARHPPFMSTSVNNDHYRLLRENKVLDYWKAIDSLHSPKWCTDNFKHLITILLAVDMTIRPSIAEIKAHPWMQGTVPSEAAIKQEFEQRQVSTIEHQIKEAQARKLRKEEARKKENARTQRAGFGPHTLKRSVTVQASANAESTPQKAAKKIKVKNFEPTQHKPTVFMSQENVEDIAVALISFFSSAKSIKIDQSKYKVPSPSPL